MPILFEHIETLAKELGFAAAGYAPAKELEYEPERYMQSMENGFFADMGFYIIFCFFFYGFLYSDKWRSGHFCLPYRDS